ncbi:Cobalamin-binding protein [Rubrivivax sp. A210]|uniref:cobalamin B12-binding domain-containing protein n=1 Tax=Rubrivivax sp. A210 TaxID=2772301 RepID=UPI001919F545|nr:cobalamin-dependent protein [Rubrivivax sp. A210]CAD5371715.1 Cobalamin-binding protein [Rubrivivax sp. A210]
MHKLYASRAPGDTLAAYLAALLAGDRDAALEAALAPVREGADVLDVHTGLLQPALDEIGRLWETGRVSVAAEHVATAITQFVVVRLYAWLVRPPTQHGRLLLTGIEGEHHQLGAHMVADALESDGWNVRFLGSDVPAADVMRCVHDFRPQVLGISCTMPANLGRVAVLIDALRQRQGADAPPTLVGGGAFRRLDGERAARAARADAWAPDLRAAVTAARTLVTEAPASLRLVAGGR